MKKKILSGVFALSLLTITGYTVQKSMSQNINLNDLTLPNVEALADTENDFCPGCLENGNGCFCINWYESCREKM